MKTITLNEVNIREIRFRPNDSEPNVTLYYDLLDEEGNVVGEKSEHVKVSDLPTKATTAVTSYFTNFSTLLENKELKTK